MANTQPLIDPVATTLDVSQGVGVSPVDLRHALGALSGPSTGATYGFASGVYPGGTSGAGMSNDLQVLPAGGLSVSANAGGYVVDRGSLGAYLGAATATITVTHQPSNPSNPRYDYVVIRNREPGVDAAPVTETAKVIVLQGQPASVPPEPTGQLTSGDVLLSAVKVRAGATSITPTDVEDRRLPVVARGGITPRPGHDDRDGSYEGMYRDNIAYKTLDRWSGTAWEPVAAPSAWNQWTPRLMCTGTGTDISMGTGPSRVGRFQLVGKRLDFSYQFRWGTAPYNGGTGDIFTRLPVHPVTGRTLVGIGYDQWVKAHLFTNTPQWVGSFYGDAQVAAGSSTVTPYFGKCHGHLPPDFLIDMNSYPYRIATTQSQPGTGIPRIFNPLGYPEGGALYITGSCEIEIL